MPQGLQQHKARKTRKNAKKHEKTRKNTKAIRSWLSRLWPARLLPGIFLALPASHAFKQAFKLPYPCTYPLRRPFTKGIVRKSNFFKKLVFLPMKHLYHQHHHHNEPRALTRCFTNIYKPNPGSYISKCISKCSPLAGEKQLSNYLSPPLSL